METFGIIFLCVLACLALWCMAKFVFFGTCFGRLERSDIFIENPPAPPQPEWLKFNLNDEIRVKLTEEGYQRLADNFNMGKWGEGRKTAISFQKKADAAGFTNMKMNDFIYQFGGQVKDLKPYVLEILIASKSLSPHTPNG